MHPDSSEKTASRRLPEKEPIAAVLSVGMTVSDMERSVELYSTVLGFERVSDTEVAGSSYEQLTGVFGLRMRVVTMKLGDEVLELTEYLTPMGRRIPEDSRSNDRWFQHIAVIVRDMDQAYERLRRHGVRHASTGPQRLPDWNKNAAGIVAFYFMDPDGHVLEVLQFPEGKGDPKWHRPTDNLFLGVDHTAIVVENTEASLKFYGGHLGLAKVGESENHGTEQEHLNNVFGARLRITTMKAAKGPGIEFLQYLTPRDGRPMPHDTRGNDIWHWQTRLQTQDAEAAARALRAEDFRMISAQAGAIPGRELGFSNAFLARDPDGHALMFTEI